MIQLLLDHKADANVVDNSTSKTALLTLIDNCDDYEFSRGFDYIHHFVGWYVVVVFVVHSLISSRIVCCLCL